MDGKYVKIFEEREYVEKNTKFVFKVNSNKVKFELYTDLYNDGKDGDFSVSDSEGMVLSGYLSKGKITTEREGDTVTYILDELVSEIGKMIKKNK